MGLFTFNDSTNLTVQNFCVQEIIEKDKNGKDFIVLHLTIFVDFGEIKYRICSDTREPNLAQIKNDLINGFNQLLNSDKDLGIEEYLVRYYIFITYADGKIKQYTAKRI
jgi:hypothetical protein